MSLKKFIEIGAGSKRPARIGYALDASHLPPTFGLQWRLVDGFSPGDEILKDAGLKDVFKAAIRDGYAIVNGADFCADGER